MKPHHIPIFGRRNLLIIGSLILIGLLCFGNIFAYSTYKKLKNVEKESESTKQASSEVIKALEENIERLTIENQAITSFLTEEQKKNLDLEKEKKKNAKKIDKLEKLTTIDPELLKKYSKVFFLSENYNPPQLEYISEQYRIKQDKDLQILKEVAPFLHNLLEAAD